VLLFSGVSNRYRNIIKKPWLRSFHVSSLRSTKREPNLENTQGEPSMVELEKADFTQLRDGLSELRDDPNRYTIEEIMGMTEGESTSTFDEAFPHYNYPFLSKEGGELPKYTISEIVNIIREHSRTDLPFDLSQFLSEIETLEKVSDSSSENLDNTSLQSVIKGPELVETLINRIESGSESVDNSSNLSNSNDNTRSSAISYNNGRLTIDIDRAHEILRRGSKLYLDRAQAIDITVNNVVPAALFLSLTKRIYNSLERHVLYRPEHSNNAFFNPSTNFKNRINRTGALTVFSLWFASGVIGCSLTLVSKSIVSQFLAPTVSINQDGVSASASISNTPYKSLIFLSSFKKSPTWLKILILSVLSPILIYYFKLYSGLNINIVLFYILFILIIITFLFIIYFLFNLYLLSEFNRINNNTFKFIYLKGHYPQFLKNYFSELKDYSKNESYSYYNRVFLLCTLLMFITLGLLCALVIYVYYITP
jgi:hypothetical protein